MLLRLVRVLHRTRRSLRDLCYTLVLLAGASAVLTYHISRRIPSRADPSAGSITEHHDHVITDAASSSRLPRDRSVSDSNGLSAEDEARIALEGAELERKFRQRLSENDELTANVDGEETEEAEEEDIAEQGELDDIGNEQDNVDDGEPAAGLIDTSEHSISTSENDLTSAAIRTRDSESTTSASKQLLNLDTEIPSFLCSNDISTLPLLSSLDVEPRLVLLPTFNASTTVDYYATAPHGAVVVIVRAVAAHCNAATRLGERNGPIGQSNFTLGLGMNRFSIYVVESSASSPSAVNESLPRVLGLYSLTIYRQPINTRLHRSSSMVPSSVSRDNRTEHVTTPLWSCSLQQDCEMKFLGDKPCGLHSSHYGSWNNYLEQTRRLPYCETGAETAEWILPCARCSDVSSCYWQQAVWQPTKCGYWSYDSSRLKDCLANKKIMFIGDSTNRGIMHYAMETVNGSLTDWDKTHDTKIYTNINENRTIVSFAYYPQFWLAPAQRPVFDETLLQLLRVTAPLENNHNTVLVVGGVHWLSTHHLVVISNVLHSRGLSKIMVIVKTLGAGFHQPVDGVHRLSLSEQRRLVQHNEDLKEQAKVFNFDIVDTFPMTMARYKDFLQGKCACHFHRIKEILPSFSEYLRASSRRPGDQLADMPIRYHVEGDINTAYSDILLGRICGR